MPQVMGFKEGDEGVPAAEPEAETAPDGCGRVNGQAAPDAGAAVGSRSLKRSRTLRSIGRNVLAARSGARYGLGQVRGVYGRDAEDIQGLDNASETFRVRRLAIQEELRTRRCFLGPDSHSRQAWDAVQVLLLCYVAVAIPARIALGLYPDPGTAEWWWEAAVDAFFIADIFINFRTAYWDEHTGDLIISTKQIKSRYLRGWFAPDVISCLPLSYLLLLLDSGDSASEGATATKIAKAVRLMKLTKMLRLARIARIYQRYEDQMQILQHARVWIQAFSLLVILLYLNHVQCCVWYSLGGARDQQLSMVGAASPDGSDTHIAVDGWLARAGYTKTVENQEVDVVSIGTQYLASLYWSVTTWTTVGYGDVLPGTNEEKIYACLAQIFGGLMFGILVARTSGLVSRGSVADAKLRERMDKIAEFLRVKRVPLDLRRRIRIFLELLYQQESAFDNKEFLQCLSPTLRKEVIDVVYLDVIGKMVLLEKVEDSSVMEICVSLRHVIYERGQQVMQERDDSSDLFIVLSGEIKITRQGVHTGSIGAGSFFGEDAVCEYYVGGREEGLQTRRTESAESLHNSSMAYLDRETCASIMDKSWQFRINVLQAFTRRYSRGERRVQEIKSLRWRAVASRIEVTVQQAEDLDIMDYDGNSDPYIVLRIKDGSKTEHKRTVTKENAGSNPVWGHPLPEDKASTLLRTTGQVLVFPSTMGRTIEIEAWDDDGLISRDDLIGAGRVEVPYPARDKYAAEEEQKTAWVTLKRRGNSGNMIHCGRVLVSIKCWKSESRKSLFSLARSTSHRHKLNRKLQSNKLLLQAAHIDTERSERQEMAAVVIQSMWRGQMARRDLRLQRHAVMRAGGQRKRQTTFHARTQRQKAVGSRMHLTSNLYERVCLYLAEQIEARLKQEEPASGEIGSLPNEQGKEASDLLVRKHKSDAEAQAEEQFVDSLEQIAKRQDGFQQAVGTAEATMEGLSALLMSVHSKLSLRGLQRHIKQQPRACAASRDDGSGETVDLSASAEKVDVHEQVSRKRHQLPMVLVSKKDGSGKSLAVSPPSSFQDKLSSGPTLPELYDAAHVADGNSTGDAEATLARPGSKLLP